MKTHLLLAALVLAAGTALAAGDNSDMKAHYDKAFSYYVAGDYPKAIEYWNLVLRDDPKQTTARSMIEDARRKMSGSTAELNTAFRNLLARGRYSDALMKMDEMLSSDPTNPYYLKAQSRLKKVSAIVPARPGNGKAWGAASEGINSWLSEKEDLAFAYDALRYAYELAPADRAFPRLIAALEEDSPQLKLNDTKPANVNILDHKKEKSLHQIYDSKFYLAVKELEGVLRLDPNDVTALKRAGSAYLQLKNYAQARRAWQKALQLSPKDTQLPEYLEALQKVAPPEEPAPRAKKKKGRG